MANPYEMRFNYFHAARDYLVNEYSSQMDRIMLSHNDDEIKIRAQKISQLKYPSTADIFALAEEIKNFSDKK
jgi:hypothetical protein